MSTALKDRPATREGTSGGAKGRTDAVVESSLVSVAAPATAVEVARDVAARLGWHVFPIVRGKKAPLTDNGYLDATNNRPQIDVWDLQWPNANWGVACGASNLLVVDGDPRNGCDLQDLAAHLPLTMRASTGSCGVHYYFSGARDCPKQLAEGIDLKSCGGYVVLPGSYTSDSERRATDGTTRGTGAYAWMSGDLHPVVAPDWLLKYVAEKTAAKRSTPRTGTAEDSLIVRMLEAAGYLLGEIRGDKQYVECPQRHLHSDDATADPLNGSTVVMGDNPGAFWCSHTSHCADKFATKEVMAMLKLNPAARKVLTEHDAAKEAQAQTDWGCSPANDNADGELGQDREQCLVQQMNSKHTVLTQVGGKCRVLSWGRDSFGRRTVVLQSFEDFRNRYCHIAEGKKSRGSWWLEHPERAEASTLCFRPDRPELLVDGDLNLWTGHGVELQAGSWALMQAFIRQVIASHDVEHERYVLDWLAWVLQNPGERAEVVLVLRGRKGTGKNTLLDAVCKLLGTHAKTVSSPKHLTGNFNAHLQDCALLFANEAIPPNDKAAEAILKTLVTDPTIAIERKGIDVEFHRNTLSIAMASNEAWCVPAGLDERRFAVFNVSDAHMQDFGYFAALRNELEHGGYEAMLHDLLARDLSGWHPRLGVPQTAGLTEQKIQSLRGADRVVYQMLASGNLLGKPEGEPANPVDGCTFVATRGAAQAAGKDSTFETGLGIGLAKCCPVGTKSAQVAFDGAKRRGYWIPALDEARTHWAAAMGLDGVAWPEADGWGE